MLKIGSCSGSMESNRIDSFDKGTSRAVPFFVFGKCAYRFSMNTQSCDSRTISPARIPVSIANKKAWKARAVLFLRSSPAECARRSNSSDVGSRARLGGGGGNLTSASGFAGIMRHSRRACVNTADSRFISRRTDPADTSASRLSRQSAISVAVTSLIASRPILSFDNLRNRISSHRAPPFFDDTSLAYRSITSERGVAPATLGALVISYSVRAAQSFASCFVGNTIDRRTPLRDTSALHPLLCFRKLATRAPCVIASRFVRNSCGPTCDNVPQLCNSFTARIRI